MKRNMLIITALLLVLFQSANYSFAQKSKADDPKMDWWKDAKFGLFIHWGLYSVPAGVYQGKDIGGIGEWIMNNGKIPVAEYAKYATQFNPVKFNADEWVKMAKDAGMKYIVITSKHHDGFALFDSKASTYDIMDATPFKRDIIKEMAEACKKQGMAFGLYYSQAQDWHVPGGAANGGHWDKAQDGNMDKYLDEVAVPQIKEILNNYGEIKVLWWDTPTDMTPERAAKFMPEIAKHPKLIYNNRLGGGFEGDLETPEQYIPPTGIPGKNWESCMTMNDTWGFKKNDHNWKGAETLIRNLIDIASKGGNYLLNVGPTSEGVIPQPSIDRLKEVGAWMKMNGEAIYGTSASPFSQIIWGRVTQKKVGNTTKLYLHIFDFPKDGKLVVSGLQNKVNKAYPLASPKTILKNEAKDADNIIDVSSVKQTGAATVIVLEISGKPIVNQTPVIKPESAVFIDKVQFEITTDTPDGVVYYTTDGSEPTIKSAVAKGKIALTSKANLTIKARTYVNGKPVSGTAVCELKQENPLQAALESKSGIRYKYFEGGWDKLPDFSKLTPIKSGVVESVGISAKNKATDYGFVFDGFINITETGVYTFYLTSDDGSRLIIDDMKTLDNDGLHGMDEVSFDLPLSKGLHKISVQFFQKGGGDGLKLEWKPAGKQRIEIEKSVLMY